MTADDAEAAEVVRRVYTHLARNDVIALINACAEDVDWSLPPRPARGREAVAEWWMATDEERELVECAPAEVVSEGGRVLARGTLRGRSRATGRVRAAAWAHEWVVRDGLVASVRDANGAKERETREE